MSENLSNKELLRILYIFKCTLKVYFEVYKKKFILNKTNSQYLEEAGGVQTILNMLL